MSPLSPSSALVAFALAAGPLSAQAEPQDSLRPPEVRAETPTERAARMRWFREARFGMFIHWGLYSQLAGEWRDQSVTGAAEWIQILLGIKSSEYSELAKSWNPSKYDPRTWVRSMKAAGVRYVCITTKHHDGFCLWPTALNDDWNVRMTPGGADLLAPLAEACRAEGLTLCFYHSVLDWHHSDWPNRPAFNDLATGEPDKQRYKREYLYPQLRELLTNYGPIGMLWLDGTWEETWTSEDGRELEAYLRELQPSLILNNRSGYKPPQPDYGFQVQNEYSYIFAGDYISPEGEVPPTGLPGIDWETCQTMQLPNNWGYNRLVGFRPFKDLLRQLIDVSSKGGNLLLNVGPTAEGELLPQAAACLEKFADWMSTHSEAIHGTSASPFERLPFDGRCTQKPGTLYLHVFAWPDAGSLLIPMRNEVKEVRLLGGAGEGQLAWELGEDGVRLSVPTEAPHPIASVIALRYEGKLEVLAPPVNLALGLPVKVSSTWPGRPQLVQEHITDGDPHSLWAAEEPARAAWVQLDLGTPADVSSALMSDAPYGRTRSYSLEAQVAGEWRVLGSGETLGAQATLHFEPVRAQVFRLSLTETSDTPTLADFQLFGQPAE